MRASYRVQTTMRVVFGLLAAATVPLAVLLGMATYHDVNVQNARVTAGIHTVSATIDDVPDPKSFPPSGIALVPVHWTATGRTHVAQLGIGPAARKGDRVPVRVDALGEPAPPHPLADPLPNALMVAFMTGALANLCLVALWRGYILVLDRRRRGQWAREWNALGDTPDWNHLQ